MIEQEERQVTPAGLPRMDIEEVHRRARRLVHGRLDEWARREQLAEMQTRVALPAVRRAQVAPQPELPEWLDATVRAPVVRPDYRTVELPVVERYGVYVARTHQVIRLAVMRYFVEHDGAAPELVLLSPLRLLSIESRQWSGYQVTLPGSRRVIVQLEAHPGMSEDEAVGVMGEVERPNWLL